MRNLFFSFLLLGLVGCASVGPKTGPLKYSLSSIKEVAIKSVPAKIVSSSPNGRELYSDYFPLPSVYARRPGTTKDGKFLERAKAKLIILGERRPYEVEVIVKVETLTQSGVYRFDRNELDYARFLAKKIESFLVKRQEKRDLIDDFRAF